MTQELVETLNKVALVYGIPKLSNRDTLARRQGNQVFINDRLIPVGIYDTLGKKVLSRVREISEMGMEVTLEDVFGVIDDEIQGPTEET